MGRNKTLGAQLNALHSERLAAVDVFTKSASILLDTAQQYRVLADAAATEAAEREIVAADARSTAEGAEAQARKILALLG